MAYAEYTSVSADKSQMEIKKVLSKYKATGFAFGEQAESATVMFLMSGRQIRFNLPLPVKGKARDKRGYTMSQNQVDQEIRRLWRCLLITIKAKLECIESGITTFEQEFLAHIVLPGGRTMGDVAIPQIEASYKNNTMPPLLGYGN